MVQKSPQSAKEQQQEKRSPAFLRDDYPYKIQEGDVEDLDTLQADAVYEIKCHQCEMSIRSQGQNISGILERIKERGCIGCGNKELVIKAVEMHGSDKDNEH